MTRKEHLLTILSEECAEVIQRVDKALRFGMNEKEPEQGLTNSERITDEYHDIIAITRMLRNEGYLKRLDQYNAVKKIEDKIRKVEKYLKYSKKCGTLNN